MLVVPGAVTVETITHTQTPLPLLDAKHPLDDNRLLYKTRYVERQNLECIKHLNKAAHCFIVATMSQHPGTANRTNSILAEVDAAHQPTLLSGERV